MLCLGIETSCDDTSLALVHDGKLVGQSSSTQADLHALFGGVVPEMASREHARYIGPLCDALLTRHGISPGDIDVVSVARGPGLLGSLLVGVAFGKAFALGTGAKFIGVNHLHAHIMVAGLEMPIQFPALALLVSGGHTHLYRVDSPESFHVLGKTLDDAAGEAFDKAGKMLGLPYPAGKHIDRLSADGVADKRLFPLPYTNNDNIDFSFSGLKTSMASYVQKHPELVARWDAVEGSEISTNKETYKKLADACASYTYSIVETLAVKTKRALVAPENAGIKSLILAGGVAANSFLRNRMNLLAQQHELAFITPSLGLCTDNGAMVAYLGYLLAQSGYEHDLSMEAIPRGQKVPADMKQSHI